MIKLPNLKLNPFWQPRYNEIVGIEFGHNILKISFLKSSNAKKEIIKLASANIAGLSDDNISKILNSSLYSVNFKKPIIVDVITPNLTITKNIEIPSTNPDEIRQIINLQAARHTPYSKDEIIVDYIELGVYKQSYTKILLIIVSKNIIKKHFEIIEKSGFNLDGVCFSPEGIVTLLGEELSKTEDQQSYILLNVDDAFTDFVIIFRNKPIFVRNIPLGSQIFLIDKEQNLGRFIEEIKKSLDAYQIEEIEKIPKQLLLVEGGLILKELQTLLSSNLPFSINFFNYLKLFSLNADVSKTISTFNKVSFLNVIATTASFGKVKVNILPEEIKLKKAFEEKSRELIKSGIFLILAFVLSFSVMITKIYFKSIYLQKLKNLHLNVSSEAKKLESDYTKVNFIRNYITNRGYSLEVLAEIYNSLPQEVELSGIRLEKEGRLVIQGTADTMSTVFLFVDRLNKVKYFKEVRTKYTSKRKEGTSDVTDFEINTQVKKEDIMKEKS
ncbi:MAG: pilus assembly protein PilM [Candidatus Omnitrophica bacterium]|nr:pilus assembly protein PilM [Candidatus Omnitrophota bacterium]